MRNLLISTRLMVLTATMLALMTLIGLLGLRALSGADQGVRTLYETTTMSLVSLGEALGEAHRSRSLVLSGMGAEDSQTAERYYQSIGAANDKVNQLWTQYQSTLQGADAAVLENAKTASQAWREYVTSGDKVISLSKSGDYEAAMSYMRNDSAKKFEVARDAIVSCMQRERDFAQASFQSITDANTSTHQMVWGGLLLGILVGSVLSYVIVRSIRRPLMGAVRLAEYVANGDLSHDIRLDQRDEVGQLLSALSVMQANLRECVGQIRLTADSVSTASDEIASGTMDLSQRTEQAASSLQQASSSMTQFSGTVQHSAESARTASALASSAVDVAERGGDLVSQVVTSMDEIKGASNRITEIIGVIDGIAFQTNILALNAAVEAARAGEQGRGFAVVAGEVRSLAGRSAEAAKEVKRLISDSVERVEGGARLAENAGQTMQEIVGSVNRVSALIADLATASATQGDDVAQMNRSVSQVDDMLQRNAALVEQSAAAAGSMKDQAQNLVAAVSIFTLKGDDPSGAHRQTPVEFFPN